MNPFDDKRMFLNEIKSLPWSMHQQIEKCPCILCQVFLSLAYEFLPNDYVDVPEDVLSQIILEVFVKGTHLVNHDELVKIIINMNQIQELR